MTRKKTCWIVAVVAFALIAVSPFHAKSEGAPLIDRLEPDSCEPRQIIKIIGSGFGNVQGDGLVHIGKKTFDSTSRKIKSWSDMKIEFKVPKYKATWFDGEAYKCKKVWVTVEHTDSNKEQVTIINPFLSASIWNQILDPDGDKNVNWDTSSGGDHYALVSDGNDATYVETGAAKENEFYAFDNPNQDGVPLAVRLWIRGKGFDSAHRNIRLALKIHGTQYASVVQLCDTFEEYYAEWEINPDDSKAWEWIDIKKLKAGVRSTSKGGGGRVSETWLEVICGDNSDTAFLTHGPVSGGVTDDSIKVWARASMASTISIRYGDNEDDVKNNTGVAQTTGGKSVDSSTDNTCVTTIAGLQSDTKYYFDILVDDVSTHSFEAANNAYWQSLPSCSTFRPEDTDIDFDFVVGGDIHGPILNHQIFGLMASKNPLFYVDLGDHTGDITDRPNTIRQKYQEVRNTGSTGRHLTANIFRRMPMFRIWSDHDAVQNNCHKFGVGDYGETFSYLELQNSLDGFKEYTPLPTLAAPDDVEGVATNGNTNTLVDTSASFDGTIHPGMVVSKTTGVAAYSFVKSVDSSTQITLFQDLSGGESFGSGTGYRIHRGGLWHKFKCANAEFFVIDTRYKRDPNGTPGGDMLDGRRYGSPPKAAGTTDGVGVNRLIDNNASFTSSVSEGDVVMNTTADTYGLVVSVDSDTTLTLGADIMGSGDDYEIYESGGTVNGFGHVQRDWLVSSINSSTAKWKFIVCELPWLHDVVKSGDKWADYDPLNALRNYLKGHVTGDNIIWLNADRHFAALDDGSHPDDPWPSVNASPLHCNEPQMQPVSGTWLVNGHYAAFDHEDGCEGAFALVRVRSHDVTIELYGPDGTLINNGTMDLVMTIPSSS